jgi:hypothetical protein
MKSKFARAISRNINDLKQIIKERKAERKTRKSLRTFSAKDPETFTYRAHHRTRQEHILRAQQRKFPNQRTGRFFNEHPELR